MGDLLYTVSQERIIWSFVLLHSQNGVSHHIKLVCTGHIVGEEWTERGRSWIQSQGQDKDALGRTPGYRNLSWGEPGGLRASTAWPPFGDLSVELALFKDCLWTRHSGTLHCTLYGQSLGMSTQISWKTCQSPNVNALLESYSGKAISAMP